MELIWIYKLFRLVNMLLKLMGSNFFLQLILSAIYFHETGALA